jgi:hypothetical protein
MTLVLTELTPHGIAMAADSAVTYQNLQTGLYRVRSNAAQKLQVIPHLNAGISCWGMGDIEGVNTDQWLSDFITSSTSLSNLTDFANELARQLNVKIAQNPSDQGRLGFHLAGFEQDAGTATPSFFHVHDGRSEVLERRGVTVDPHKFNANHDMPPQQFLQLAQAGRGWITRNGDYQIYAQVFSLLENFFKQLEDKGIIIPHSQDLRDRAEYLIFQIRTISEIYRLSNLVRGIGGGIHFLTINPVGIHSQGVRYL